MPRLSATLSGRPRVRRRGPTREHWPGTSTRRTATTPPPPSPFASRCGSTLASTLHGTGWAWRRSERAGCPRRRPPLAGLPASRRSLRSPAASSAWYSPASATSTVPVPPLTVLSRSAVARTPSPAFSGHSWRSATMRPRAPSSLRLSENSSTLLTCCPPRRLYTLRWVLGTSRWSSTRERCATLPWQPTSTRPPPSSSPHCLPNARTGWPNRTARTRRV
mmetsp:Transcript_16148/g.50513  ORF Transcript_16148/g.50513 Transcript_16148/m.50513 type:complete len:220 (+) Transcript_16148:193-852(+)